MAGDARPFALLPFASLLCFGACLTTEGYYRNRDAGASGAAGGGATGAAGDSGGAGSGGSAATGGAAGTAGNAIAGSGGSSAGGSTGGPAMAGRGGTTGAAGRGGTTGTGGRGGTTGTGGRGGTTGTGTAGTSGVLLSENFDPMTNPWDFGATVMHSFMTDTAQGQSLFMTESAGDEALAAAGLPSWTNISVEAKVKVTALTGTSSSDGVAICARLAGVDSYYYFAIQAGDMKGKIKINNGSNSSLGSSFDAGFMMNSWMTMRLDVTGTPATGITLTAYVNGAMKYSYVVPATETDHLIAMGGMGFMVRKASAQFDDVVVRALP